jgi:N-acetylgalactosamine PTS system EIIA component
MSSAVRAVVIGHADFAAGIVSAVEQITGNGARLMPLSNATLSTDGIEEMLRAVLQENDAHVVFTDLPAGSATMAVRRLQKTVPGITVVAGTNLAVLLDFVQQRDEAPEEGALHALEKGKATMIAFRGRSSSGG